MWAKYLIIVILFYFFAVLQNSFFVHLNLLGTTPNFVFIFFLLLVFFSARGGPAFGWEEIFYAITAGLFLDVFSSAHLGASVVMLIIIGFLTKKICLLLSEKNDKYPFAYFLSLFFISFIIYNLFFGLYFFWVFGKDFVDINWRLAAGLIYNLLSASVIFWVYKIFFSHRMDNRQLSLFKNR